MFFTKILTTAFSIATIVSASPFPLSEDSADDLVIIHQRKIANGTLTVYGKNPNITKRSPPLDNPDVQVLAKRCGSNQVRCDGPGSPFLANAHSCDMLIGSLGSRHSIGEGDNHLSTPLDTKYADARAMCITSEIHPTWPQCCISLADEVQSKKAPDESTLPYL